MQEITVQLTEEERAVFEYRAYEFQGLDIKINQFVTSDLAYNAEHYNRLISTYLEKYAAFQKHFMNILAAHGYKDITPNGYFINNNELKVMV